MEIVNMFAYKYARTLVKMEIDDIKQELFVHLLVELNRRQHANVSLSWFKLVCANRAKDLYRRQNGKMGFKITLATFDEVDESPEYFDYVASSDETPELNAIEEQEQKRFDYLVQHIEELCTPQEKALLQALLFGYSMADLALPGESRRNTTARLAKIKASLRVKARIVLELHK